MSTTSPADWRPEGSGRGWLSLTRRFALVSMIGIAVIGLYLVYSTSAALSDQAARYGVANAEAVARITESHVRADAYTSGVLTALEAEQLQTFADALVQVLDLRLWTADGTVLFDSAASVDPTSSPPTIDDEGPDGVTVGDRLRAAVAGTSSTRPLAGREAGVEGPLLEVYAPITYDGRPVGAVQLIVDGTATAAAQGQAVRSTALIAGAGLVTLWVLLYRLVHNASQKLQRTAAENARLALLDALTGLPNRRMLLDRLERAVSTARRGGGAVGVLLLDVDQFKEINDSLGHERGDELLVQISARLMGIFRGRDLVARLGGDEFAVLLPGLLSVEDAVHLAERARAAFTRPFTIGEMSVHVDTSIGVAVLPDHAVDVSDLIRKADVAMYTAKQRRTGVAVYSAADDESSPARLVLQGELRRALDQPGELAMRYQPTVDLSTGRTVGLEALMRWEHPTRGPIEPAVFIPLAEQSGLIDKLTFFTLRTVVDQLARWPEETRLPIAVNLSGHAVATGKLAVTVRGLLAEQELESHWLEVEITEEAVLIDPGRVVPALRQLADAGIRVAIDDFGIGTTSFAHLRDLPIDKLKIDPVFVADLTGADRARTVVKAMVDLAHSFGLRVVAEGVEDSVTADILADLGVDQAQGFWYSRELPMPGAVRIGARDGVRDTDDAAARAGRGLMTDLA